VGQFTQRLPEILFCNRRVSSDDDVLMAAMAATENLSAGRIFE
jgi:hypothetical protein